MGQEFAFGKTEELVDKMKEVYKDIHVEDNSKRLDNRIKAGLKTAEKWTWTESINRLDKILSERS